MITIYLAVDEDRTETKWKMEPYRGYDLNNLGVWDHVCAGHENIFEELPPGTIEKLTGRKITWKDKPIEYSGGE